MPLQNLQRHAGKTGAGTHIDHRFAGQVCKSQHGGAIQQMQLCHVCGVCDGGEVHHLVFFQQHFGKSDQLRSAALIQAVLLQSLLQ